MPKPDASNPAVAPLADKLRDALAEVPKGRTGREPSPLRKHVAAVFDELVARRKAGATWEGLAKPFAALGVLTERGEAPTGVDLRNAFHAERYVRGGKRRRRGARPKVTQPAPAPPTEPPPPPLPSAPRPLPSAEPSAPSSPSPAADPSNPYAEVERQTAEAKRRREQVEAAKDWNPYATKEKPDE